jgi:hypothetical protein
MAAKTPNDSKLDGIVARARRDSESRQLGYREQALKLYPWICGRCAREFGRERVRELTVHHKDGNHENNPTDGSNWELLCVYCHENEHARVEDSKLETPGGTRSDPKPATHRALEGLGELLKKK